MNCTDYTIKAIFFFPPDIITLPLMCECVFFFPCQMQAEWQSPGGSGRVVVVVERRDLLRYPATIGVEEQKQRGAPLERRGGASGSRPAGIS